MRVILAFLLTLAMGAAALAANQRLVLKDGNYQLVRSYERRGDRVRFFSVERGEWEEMPASLVDWAATEKANRDASADAERRATEAASTDREAAAQKAGELSARLGHEVEPGIYLPDEDGLFVALEGKLAALPKQQAGARVDKGRLLTNVVLPIPVLRNRSLVEIPGAASTMRLPASPAVLYANGRAREDSRYVLAKLKVKNKARQIGAISTNMIGRDPKHAGDYVELRSETIGPNVFKLTPARALDPGEYAVLEFLGNDLKMFLWDFSVGR